MITVICKTCRKPFDTYPSYLARRPGGSFCSRRCSANRRPEMVIRRPQTVEMGQRFLDMKQRLGMSGYKIAEQEGLDPTYVNRLIREALRGSSPQAKKQRSASTEQRTVEVAVSGNWFAFTGSDDAIDRMIPRLITIAAQFPNA